jgi:hypothetical protein
VEDKRIGGSRGGRTGRSREVTEMKIQSMRGVVSFQVFSNPDHPIR